jgi:hypothetical protein
MLGMIPAERDLVNAQAIAGIVRLAVAGVDPAPGRRNGERGL